MISSCSPIKPIEANKMNKKVSLIFLLLAILAVSVPAASAAYLDDEWFVDKAITNVEEDYGLQDLEVDWNGVVTSNFEVQFRPYVPVHKHASIVGSFGFANSGYVQWDGRVYVAPWRTIYEIHYTIVAPRSPKLSTDVVNPSYKYSWDGSKWVENTPTITIVDGRTRVYYPKP